MNNLNIKFKFGFRIITWNEMDRQVSERYSKDDI